MYLLLREIGLRFLFLQGSWPIFFWALVVTPSCQVLVLWGFNRVFYSLFCSSLELFLSCLGFSGLVLGADSFFLTEFHTLRVWSKPILVSWVCWLLVLGFHCRGLSPFVSLCRRKERLGVLPSVRKDLGLHLHDPREEGKQKHIKCMKGKSGMWWGAIFIWNMLRLCAHVLLLAD